ncbi:Glycoside hydrolase, 38 vacuolar alpha mannosidase [Mortierella alpina]|nr:Glycoside hydrolase, 38 vacuolar alpha mannosidase [Mortierella alpina]
MATLSAQPRFLRSITVDRAAKFSSEEFFSDINLYSQLYSKRSSEAIGLSVYSVPDLKRIPFDEAVKQTFEPTTTGVQFGPSWSTHWFRLKINVPKEWAGEQVELLWDSNSEAMIWSVEGVPRQGLTGDRGNDRRVEYSLLKKAKGGETVELFVEMACNGMFGTGKNGLINPPDENRFFQLSKAEIAVPNKTAWKLFYDMQIIVGMANELPNESARAQETLRVCNKVIDSYDWHDVEGTLQKCLQITGAFLSKKSAPDVHRITAVGNCHIDTAWLWPYAETRRKTARSWSTQLRLMEDYPEYVFVCSQAQQLEWLSQDYPRLFEEIQQASKNGRFQVIGATWVEMDCNMPSGEALCRQFLYGQRFYEKNFGNRCKVFWLPDTFGYSAQLPQILKEAGAQYFFTQKLSWNNINKFPNTTFTWVGLDGTKVLTHMAPCETYTAQADVSDMVRSIKNNRDLAFSNQSLLPYGNGDGGGGPQRAMIERLRRMKDIDGLPRCEMGGAEAFFKSVEKEAEGLQEWKGELYFELHRGTYTSQAAIKRYNRKLEFLLRDVEIVSTLCLGRGRDYKYPKADLDLLWKDLLLNQFHDVLPGSCIELASIDAREIYKKVEAKARCLLDDGIQCLYQSPVVPGESASYVALNTLGWTRSEIIEIPSQAADKLQQYSAEKSTGYVRGISESMLKGFNTEELSQEGPGRVNSDSSLSIIVEQCAFGYQDVADFEIHSKVADQRVKVLLGDSTAFAKDKDFILENDQVIVKFNQRGHLISFFDKNEVRELVPEGQGGNKLQLYSDVPLYWEAWDVEMYHLNTGKDAGPGRARIGEVGPLRATIIVEHALTKTSTAVQTIILTADSPRLDFQTTVDWNEGRTLLKVEFMWDIHSDTATYDSQFGVVQRPTTYNTSHDFAKFEVCGHKFADLSEHGYGVALLNDSKYGYSCHGNVMRLSLLRSPKAPDAHCDIGHHEFSFAVYPHKGTFHESNVVRESYQFNVPMIVRPVSQGALAAHTPVSLFEIEGAKNVILDTVKRAEDSDDIIVRLHEAFGGRAMFKLKSVLDIQSIRRCNILEDDGAVVEFNKELRTSNWLVMRAFEILTLKLKVNSSESSDDENTRQKPKRTAVLAKKTTRSTSQESIARPRSGTVPPAATVPSTRTSKRLAEVTEVSGSSNSARPLATTSKKLPSISPSTRTSQRSVGASTSNPTTVAAAKEAPQKKTVVRKRGAKAKAGSTASVAESDGDLDAEDAGDHGRQPEFVGPTEVASDETDTEISKLKHVSWMYPHLLDGKRARLHKTAAMDIDQPEGHFLEHILRAHSRSTHDGQDETETDVWSVAFQPTSKLIANGQVADNLSGPDSEDDEEKLARLEKRRQLTDETLRQSKKSSSIAATCGGNTVCLIDCRLGRVMAKYSHVEEEAFMCLAWTTLDHDVEGQEEGDLESKGNADKRREQSDILAAAGRLGSIKLINPLQNTCYKYLHGHTEAIVRLKFSLTNPRWLFSASMDGTVRLWDIGSLTGYDSEACCLATFGGLDDSSVTAIGVSEKYLIAGTELGLMAQYDLFQLTKDLESRTNTERKTALKVQPDKLYPCSQEWHESSIDDIIYIPHFSEKSYAAIARHQAANQKTKGPKSNKPRKGGKVKTFPISADEEVDANDGEFVFASRESCQGEILVWEANQSTDTDAALKTILDWCITESWTKFTLAENIATELKKSKVGGKGSKAKSLDGRRHNILVGGSTDGKIVLYDLSRKPIKSKDGDIIAQKPSRIIAHADSTQLLRDVAFSQDLSMIVASDWTNRVLVWNYRNTPRSQ